MVRFLILPFLGAATFSAPLPSTDEKPASPAGMALPGGGLTDAAGKVGYFMGPKGGLLALDLGSGKVLWHVVDAERPLLATADRLFGQAAAKGKNNEVRIIVFDVSKEGRRLLESEPITFPDWVSVGVALGRTFRSTARLDNDQLLYGWEASARYAGGAPPPKKVLDAARKDASGVAKIDLKSGKVVHLSADRVPKDLLKSIPAETGLVKLGGRTLTFVDRPAADRANPFARRRALRATDAAGKLLWEQEIAAPVFLPPPP